MGGPLRTLCTTMQLMYYTQVEQKVLQKVELVEKKGKAGQANLLDYFRRRGVSQQTLEQIYLLK